MNALWQLLENQTVHSINELFLFPFLRGCPILAPQHTLYIGKMSLTRLMWEALLLFPPTTILSHNQMLLSYDHSILFTLLLSFFFFLRWIWFWVRTLFFFPLSNGAFFFSFLITISIELFDFVLSLLDQIVTFPCIIIIGRWMTS